MKLSDVLYNDFLKELEVRTTKLLPITAEVRLFPMSYDYLVGLIEKVKELEEKATKYDDYMNLHHNEYSMHEKSMCSDMLEKLPKDTCLEREGWADNAWNVHTSFNDNHILEPTPAQALKKYWEKENEDIK